MRGWVWCLAMLLAASVACQDNPEDEDGSPTPMPDMVMEPDPQPTPDPNPQPDPEPEPTPDICEKLSLPRDTFKQGDGGLQFGDIAGDFTVNRLDAEPWTLSEAFTGCESYVFLNYFPDLRANPVGEWVGDTLWKSRIVEFITAGPANTHYFFTSFEESAEDRMARMEDMRDRLEIAYQATGLSTEEQDAWRAHFHFVTDRLVDIEGSVGGFARDYLDYAFDPASREDLGDRGQAPPPLPDAFAIDRAQTWDPGGSLNELVGSPPIFAMAAYLGHFYNFKAGVRHKVDAETDVTAIELINGDVTERIIPVEVTLPDAATMATFDTLEIDVDITCPFRNPFACSEWDRNARIDLCLDAECTDRREVARWITQYWRRGNRRWIIEASPMIAMMQAGGAHTFRIEMGPGWERKTERNARIELRFANRGKAKPRGMELAYRGGEFNEDYNDNHPPFGFQIPEEASSVELVVLLSGHGQTGPGNCAEWCDHRHEFTLSGIPVADLQPGEVAGSLRGCAEQAHLGVPPGQWGNWAPGRAYWCPGLPVQPLRFDMTRSVRTGGATNSLIYGGNLSGGEPRGGSIDMSTYVVWYEDP